MQSASTPLIAYQEGFCWGSFGRQSDSLLVRLLTECERLFRLRRLTLISPWTAFIARQERQR
jgi:hypothetical protein